MQPRRLLPRYGVAFGSAVLMGVIATAVYSVAGNQTPVYLMFTAAVSVAAGLGGLGPGLVAAGVSVAMMSTWVALGLPLGQLAFAGRAYLGLFVAICVLISAVSELLRAGYRRAEDLRAAADAGRSRLALLTEAGELLAGSTDIRSGLDAVARAVIPRLGDWCAIHLTGDDGALALAAAAHCVREREDTIKRLSHAYPPDRSGVNPLQRALSSGVADMRQDIDSQVLIGAAHDAQHLQDLRDLGFRAYICAPLLAREKKLGAIMLVSGGRRPYTDEDVAVVSSLSRRIALAVDNARLLRAAELEVAERRRAETALLASQARLAGIIDTAMDAIVGVDGAGRVAVFNRAAEAMFGCEAREAIGEPVSRFVLGDPQPHARSGDGAAAGQGRDAAGGAVEGIRAGGERFPVEVSASHAEAGGEGLQTLIIRDITERRRTEEEIGDLNDRLRQAMTETHHRVKNNLQVIAAMIDLRLLDGEPTVPAAEWRRLGDYVRALAMLHDVLTHESRTVGATLVVRSRTVIGRILALLEEGLGPSVEITHNVDDVPLTARQGTSLAIVVSELVGNAVKHGDGKVDVALRAVDGVAVLTVRDHGPGFPPGFDAAAEAHTGLQLVTNLSEWDLGGHASFGVAPGGGGLVSIATRIDPTAAASDAEEAAAKEGRASGSAE